MLLTDLIATLERIAPLRFAEPWDNVGLLIGSERWPATRIMLTIDLTETVLQEAIDGGIDAIVAYHPPIFHPLPALTDAAPAQRIPLLAAAAKIAVYSPHTALDAAPEGLNDWLARGLGHGDVRPLVTHESLPESEQNKIVTFCPAEAADTIRNALASAGCGRIGDYELCSFEIRGRGSFLGGATTHPAVGRAGQLEQVDEVRLEMVCATAALALAVATLREFHPYEEPPIEIYRLQPRPIRTAGAGRRVVLDQKADLATLVERLKRVLGVRYLRVAAGLGSPRSFGTVGLCAGAGAALLDPAVAQGCEAFFTGEMRHHDVIAAQARGCTVILSGHTNSERGYLKVLRRRLAKMHPELHVAISRRDGSPWKTM